MPANSEDASFASESKEDEVLLFDCNSTLGRRAARNPRSVYNVHDLLSVMDSYSITRALVSHASCEVSGPTPGNEILMSETKGTSRLVPCWVVLPNHTKELGEDISDFFRRMLSNDVKAAKIYPVSHHFSLSEWSVGHILEKLDEHRMPLLIDFNIVHYSDAVMNVQWDKVHDICARHRDLPVILLRLGANVDRNLFPLLGMFENLHVDLSYYTVNEGIERICDMFGPEHLIFGTGLPVMSPAGPISMLMYSNIPLSMKRSIASENLERMLESVVEQ